MLIKGHQIKVPMFLNLILMLIYMITASEVNADESRKLDETTVTAITNGTDIKCTPCGNYSPPPPPANPPPSPPPPSPKKPPSQNCPPPPSTPYIYITGPPGNLYPIDEDYSEASHRHHRSFAALLLPLAVALLSMIAF
uniref:Formin-like protein 10 n=1 Tax=Cicer arietinum TaxID=3827 RepID=A0A1S2YIE5_CICAR|nr:formin-like protein 10 [Cicer arietinum]